MGGRLLRGLFFVYIFSLVVEKHKYAELWCSFSKLFTLSFVVEKYNIHTSTVLALVELHIYCFTRRALVFVSYKYFVHFFLTKV